MAAEVDPHPQARPVMVPGVMVMPRVVMPCVVAVPRVVAVPHVVVVAVMVMAMGVVAVVVQAVVSVVVRPGLGRGGGPSEHADQQDRNEHGLHAGVGTV